MAGCGSEDSSSGAGSTAAESEESKEATDSKEEPTLEEKFNVKLIGRTYYSNGTLWLGMSGTGVEFTYTGDKVTINTVGNPAGMDNAARVAVYVNGERVEDKILLSDGKTFEIPGGGSEPVDVKFVKLSECAQSCCGITNIDPNGGTIEPVADKSRRIEIIGDSITCGYGVDAESEKETFSTMTEDCTKSYSIKTAKLLDADYSLFSISGYGIISGYTTSNKPVSEQTIPQYYNKLGYTWNTGFGTEKPENIDWDFSKFVPDVIVINLGTNDMSYTGGRAERQEEYKNGYIDFLKQVREKNPSARIFCTLGIMGTTLNSTMREAVEAYSAETGDTNITAFDFPQQNGAEDGLGADWHPSDTTHTKSAELLAAKIKEDMGW
ncbi:MAG: GDSL family lipase [Ruminococcus sp.]|nr:GDSL family lipase [Ruminococcus sp.]